MRGGFRRGGFDRAAHVSTPSRCLSRKFLRESVPAAIGSVRTTPLPKFSVLPFRSSDRRGRTHKVAANAFQHWMLPAHQTVPPKIRSARGDFEQSGQAPKSRRSEIGSNRHRCPRNSSWMLPSGPRSFPARSTATVNGKQPKEGGDSNAAMASKSVEGWIRYGNIRVRSRAYVPQRLVAEDSVSNKASFERLRFPLGTWFPVGYLAFVGRSAVCPTTTCRDGRFSEYRLFL